jgi:hypothetical protein
MSDNLKDKTLLVVDNGLFFELALTMARSYKKVYYYIEWKDAYPGMAKAVIGTEWKNGKQLDTFDGLPFERVENMFDYIDKADVIFFPDIYNGDLIEYLRKQGKPVFGSGRGEELELERWHTKQYFKKIGMDVQPMERVIGIDKLRERLQQVENKWIKLSKYRKIIETFHHKNYGLTEPLLDKMEWELGPMSHILEYIIEDNIEAVVEEGMDGFTVDGKYPNYLIQGCEIKDLSYAGKFIKYSELSKGCKVVNEQIAPMLKNYGYRGLFSTEVRTTAEGKHYFIDPCCRGGSPPNELYQEMYANLAEIVWEGAHGRIADPKPVKPFGIEVLIHADSMLNTHQAVYFPPEIRQWVKLRNTLKIDDQYYTLNLHGLPEVGALVAIGNSFEECKKKLEEMAPKVEGYHLSIKTDAIDQAIEEYNKMAKG